MRYEEKGCQDAQVIICAFGTTARIVSSAIKTLNNEGIKAGLFRPITVWPYPSQQLLKLASQDSVQAVLTVEMNLGQMHEDVRLAIGGTKPTPFYGRTGGMIPEPRDIVQKVRDILKEANK